MATKKYYRHDLVDEEGDEAPRGLFADLLGDEDDAGGHEEEPDVYVPLKKRREMDMERAKQNVSNQQQKLASTSKEVDVREDEKREADADARKTSLLMKTVQSRKHQKPETAAERQWKEEQEIMRNIEKQRLQLKSAKEIAESIEYSRKEAIDYSWEPPHWMLEASKDIEKMEKLRKRLHIIAEGTDVAPPLETFESMKIPRWMIKYMKTKNIMKPTPIQMQGLPVAFTGRDMIGIAFTGSGKTLTFVLPSLLAALIEEYRMPIRSGEGPIAIVVCPSRELARQTFQVLNGFVDALHECRHMEDIFPKGSKCEQMKAGRIQLKTLLCIGGVDMKEQTDSLRRDGVHIVVATPGRLKDHLSKRRMNLDSCRYIVLDEADRMIDLGFEEDVREILSYFKAQRQTLLFSATMPEKIRLFANKSLTEPVIVNVGRAGAANLNVVQEVEYVKAEDKTVHLLQCLQKTAPPVMVFCENKADVDAVYEYFLLKGVDAAAVHGSLDQSAREEAIDEFKSGKKDVLVATDVASKGLDFPSIQHVVNFDMPSEIENYVHRIGRTGRRGKTGVATTLVNHQECSESTLLDLKQLLKEAKQKIPPILASLDDPFEMQEELVTISGIRGCAYCGGLGHRVTECPKLATQDREITRKSRGAAIRSGGFGSEM